MTNCVSFCVWACVFALLSVFHLSMLCSLVTSGLGSSQYCRSESVATEQVLCLFLTHKHSLTQAHKRTHIHPPPTPLSPFVFLGSTHLQPYYPESSAAAQLALHCWSVLLVTSAPSARSTQLRSSGISPMENLLRIQKKPVHTSNCDGVFHPGSTALFSPLSPWMKSCFISPV